MASIIEQLIVDCKDQIKVGTLDIDTSERVVKKYGVSELPILLFFKNGRVIVHIIGAVPREVMAEKLSALLQTE